MEARDQRRPRYHSMAEVTKRYAVTPRTLRYYEQEGLLHPARTAGGTRLYSDFDLRRLEACLHLAGGGVPIRILRMLAGIRPGSATGAESSAALLKVFDELRADLRAVQDHVRFLLSDLDLTEDAVRGCLNCPNRPSRSTCPGCPAEQRLQDGAAAQDGATAPRLLHLTWDDDRSGDDARPEGTPG